MKMARQTCRHPCFAPVPRPGLASRRERRRVIVTYTGDTDSKALELTTRQQGHITLIDMTQLKHIQDLLEVVELLRLVKEGLDRLLRAANGLGELVDILRLHNGGQVVFQKLCEVVLKLGAPEVLDDVLPVRRVVEPAQVGLQFSTEDLQSGTLADTVRSNETQHVSRPRHRQSVQLEAVGGVSVGDLALEVGGQVDDGDGTERAFLGADTASDAEGLGNEGQAGVGGHFNACSRDSC